MAAILSPSRQAQWDDKESWFVKHLTVNRTAESLTLLLLTVREMYREYVSPTRRTNIVDRHIHRRDVRHGGLTSEIHAVVSVPEKRVSDNRRWEPTTGC